MSTLSDVGQILVPRRLVHEAHAHLQQVGKRRLEAFALWAGVLQENVFHVQQTRIPEQTSLQTRSGLCVTVGPDEMHQINLWLYRQQLRLIAQIHSHPTDAYHSDTDDAYPIATTAGSLSIVVPNFAQGRFDLGSCAVYRLSTEGGWIELDPATVRELIHITEDKPWPSQTSLIRRLLERRNY